MDYLYPIGLALVASIVIPHNRGVLGRMVIFMMMIAFQVGVVFIPLALFSYYELIIGDGVDMVILKLSTGASIASYSLFHLGVIILRDPKDS